jgi:hypothetical protein
MNPKRSISTVQLLTLGLLISVFWLGVAQAAPLYRGKFTLPYSVRWGQTVLPAGEYQLRFQDVQSRVFAVIQDAKTHKDVAFVPAMVAGEAQGGSVLLIVGEGNQRVVHSLRLAELRVAFTYEPTPAHGTKGVEEARTVQALPITATGK